MPALKLQSQAFPAEWARYWSRQLWKIAAYNWPARWRALEANGRGETPARVLVKQPGARRHGIKLVIGTTGFSEQQRAGIEIASRALPIVLAPNMSMGVNLYLKL